MPDSPNPYASSTESTSTATEFAPALGTREIDGPWIQFHLDIDDIAEFNLHLMDRSRFQRVQRRRLLILSVFAIAPVFLLAFLPTVPWSVFLPLLFLIGFILAAKLLNRTLVRRNIRRLMSESDNQNMFGIQELQRTDAAIIHRSIACKSRFHLNAFVRIDETPQYWFLFTSSLHAIIVPKRSIISGNANAVIDELITITD